VEGSGVEWGLLVELVGSAGPRGVASRGEGGGSCVSWDPYAAP
jgi:hypothetical protein